MRKADNLPPFCSVVTKSGNLKFLEPSGPVQACNGTDFYNIVMCYDKILVNMATYVIPGWVCVRCGANRNRLFVFIVMC